jgi:hypothetical protein
MFVLDQTRVFSMFLKLGEAIFFIFMALQIRQKNREYILNKIFAAAFISFAIYLISDSLAYLFAPQGYVWYMIGRIFYVIGYTGLFSYSFILVNGVRVIKNGEIVLEDKVKLWLLFGITFVCLGLFLVSTKIKIYNGLNQLIDPQNLPPTDSFYMTEGLTTASIIASILPLIFYGFAVTTIIRIINSSQNPSIKRNMIFMGLGIAMIPIGIIYFMVRGLIWQEYSIFSTIIGHIFYISSPIAIYFSSSRKS